MIQGERVYLRPIEYEDIDILNKWKNSESVFKFLGGGFSPVSISQHSKWLDSLVDLTGNNRRFIICHKEKEYPIGVIGLYGINWIHRTSEIGVYIGEEAFLGQGFGAESCKLIEKFAKEYLNLRKIKLNVVEANQNALKFWLKLDYKKVGTQQDERYIQGKYYDLVIMEKIL